MRCCVLCCCVPDPTPQPTALWEAGMWPDQSGGSGGGGGEEPAVTLSAADGGGRAGRLLLVAGLAVAGSVGNVFMISAIITEDHLRKRGNAFLANAALADLLVTGVVMPASSVAILAGTQDSLALCRAQWLLAVVSLLVSAQTHAALAADGLARLALRPERYAAHVTVPRVAACALLAWATASAAAGVHFALRLPPQPCAGGPPPAAAAAASAAGVALLLGLPTLAALVTYARAAGVVRAARARPSFKPAVTFGWDYALLKTNAWSALLLVATWLPVGVVLAVATGAGPSAPAAPSPAPPAPAPAAPAPAVPRLVVHHLAWLALSKSCINSLLYCITNRHFRAAYVNLFHYCCCKTSVAFSRRARGGGVSSALAGGSCSGGGGGGGAMSSCVSASAAAAEVGGGGGGGRPAGDVRVHIIPGYNMYSYTSPQRSRDCRPGRANGRDVYEL